jgi:hypothetical protein
MWLNPSAALSSKLIEGLETTYGFFSILLQNICMWIKEKSRQLILILRNIGVRNHFAEKNPQNENTL